ncbi:MAG TPA: Rpn family recombination-promoting nuclease/putative transposase [Leptospiraceae bacterium]|nr:Rpn family recombination-promoting nuclease/putative transposase [Leptospiraceae bacterium]HMW05902.1 Rpn family recombination-promoting nuclease/putative transposase [Leptospiraceae bacterium]HMX32680.1 Rpn family recombination-promoting nuclease/putative transposase [Leptospiraceae bacterium]HMY32733.1 Rpn family recombination-promoting nuclease/putative transposase [Leptospiraceae bacterium]HNA05773.1 Rpn family recombination-promoting nuclease/putative transposase [Leptospiraceae bacteri
MRIKLLPLTNDYIFKSVFGKHEDVILNLINSFPEFIGEGRIEKIQILNPEIPRDGKFEKSVTLDMKAMDTKGNHFLIEMQATDRLNFSKRILYYWSKLYSKSISKGELYIRLPKVYSFNFVNFEMFKNKSKFYWHFQLIEKDDPQFLLTEDLSIRIIEIPKLIGEFAELKTPLEYWVYLLKEASSLKGETMKALQKKNPKIKKAIQELRFVSLNKKSREYYEMKEKAEKDYGSMLAFRVQEAEKEAMEKGWAQGVEKGIEEGLEKGLEKGRREGRKEGIKLVVEKLLAAGYKKKEISRLTGLRLKDI